MLIKSMNTYTFYNFNLIIYAGFSLSLEQNNKNMLFFIKSILKIRVILNFYYCFENGGKN